MRNLTCFALLGLLSLSTIGCAAQPELRQMAVRDHASTARDAYDSYGLQSTLVQLDAEGGVPKMTTKIVDPKSGSEADVLFQLFLDDPFYQTTKLSITKRDGTSVVETAGVEVLDARKEYIAAAAKLLTTAISITTPVAGEPSLEKNAKLPYWRYVEEMVPNQRDAYKDVLANGIEAKFGAVQHHAIALNEIVDLGNHDYDGLYFSACRDLILTVYTAADDEALKLDKNARRESIFFTKVADPRYVVRQPFPLSGKLSSHESCGVSTANETTAAQAAPLPGLIEAISDASKSVDQAADEAEKARKARREAEEAARKAKEAEKKAKQSADEASAPGS